MKNETARREIEALDYYLQNHTSDYSEESHMAMMMASEALEITSCIKEKCAYCPHCENCDVDDETFAVKALEQQACEEREQGKCPFYAS